MRDYNFIKATGTSNPSWIKHLKSLLPDFNIWYMEEEVFNFMEDYLVEYFNNNTGFEVFGITPESDINELSDIYEKYIDSLDHSDPPLQVIAILDDFNNQKFGVSQMNVINSLSKIATLGETPVVNSFDEIVDIIISTKKKMP